MFQSARSPQIEFEMDSTGMVVTRPVLGWTTAPVAGMAVLLKLRYAKTPKDIGTEGHSLQCVLTPQQALELSDTLTEQAQRILNEPMQQHQKN